MYNISKIATEIHDLFSLTMCTMFFKMNIQLTDISMKRGLKTMYKTFL